MLNPSIEKFLQLEDDLRRYRKALNAALDLLIKNENSIEKTKLELKSMDFIK